MAVRQYKPVTPGRRFMSISTFEEITKGKKPEKSLLQPIKKSGGRNNQGVITVRKNVGGGNKQMYRIIDFKRDKDDSAATVASVEYDPNRSARIALLQYADGEKRYIMAPRWNQGWRHIISGSGADIKPGNAMPIRNIPTGTRFTTSN